MPNEAVGFKPVAVITMSYSQGVFKKEAQPGVNMLDRAHRCLATILRPGPSRLYAVQYLSWLVVAI